MEKIFILMVKMFNSFVDDSTADIDSDHATSTNCRERAEKYIS